MSIKPPDKIVSQAPAWYAQISPSLAVGFKQFRVLGLQNPYLVEPSGCAEVWQPGWNQTHACLEFSYDGDTPLSSPVFVTPHRARFQQREQPLYNRLQDTFHRPPAQLTALVVFSADTALSDEPGLLRPAQAKIVALINHPKIPGEQDPPFQRLAEFYQADILEPGQVLGAAPSFGVLLEDPEPGQSLFSWEECTALATSAAEHFASALADPSAKAVVQDAGQTLLPVLLYAAHIGDNRSVQTLDEWASTGWQALPEILEHIREIGKSCGLIEIQTGFFLKPEDPEDPGQPVCPLDWLELNNAIRALHHLLKQNEKVQDPVGLDNLFYATQGLLYQIPNPEEAALDGIRSYLQAPALKLDLTDLGNSFAAFPLTVSLDHLSSLAYALYRTNPPQPPVLGIELSGVGPVVINFLQHHLFATCYRPQLTMTEFRNWFLLPDLGLALVTDILQTEKTILLSSTPAPFDHQSHGGGPSNDLRDILRRLNRLRFEATGSIGRRSCMAVVRDLINLLPDGQSHPIAALEEFLAGPSPSSSE